MRKWLLLVALSPVVALACCGVPGPCWGPWWFRYTHPNVAPAAGAAVVSNTSGQAAPAQYPIGGPFCSQCHVEPPTVNYIYPVGAVKTVSGTVLKSAPTIAVVVNGNNVYHVRFPAFCQPPRPGENVTLTVFIRMGAKAQNLNWYMGVAQSCPPS